MELNGIKKLLAASLKNDTVNATTVWGYPLRLCKDVGVAVWGESGMDFKTDVASNTLLFFTIRAHNEYILSFDPSTLQLRSVRGRSGCSGGIGGPDHGCPSLRLRRNLNALSGVEGLFVLLVFRRPIRFVGIVSLLPF